MYRDDSELKYTAARGYRLSDKEYKRLLTDLATQKASSPTYNMLSNNCTSWVIKNCKPQVDGVALYRANLIDGEDPVDIYVPRSLAVFLVIGKPGTRPFRPTMPE